MNRRSPAQEQMARRLLAHEAAAEGTGGPAAAGARVLDKIREQLVPLIGSAGVQALFVRSVKLTRGEFDFLEAGAVESGSALRSLLEAQEPAMAGAAAEALFGAFLTLIATYIGERLTATVLRGAWPTIRDSGPLET